MSRAYYRSGQAAKLWGISSHLVRRLCEGGQVRAERSEGGQWKIPYSEVERIQKEGVPEIPSSIKWDHGEDQEEEDGRPGHRLLTPRSDWVVTSADEVVVAENHLERLQIDQESAQTRDWIRECRRLEADAKSHDLQASLDKAAREQAERERIDWHDSWMAKALLQLPQEAPPETRLAVREAVDEVLAGLGPRHSWQVVDSLVRAAVEKALQPWNQARQTTWAIENACQTLPWGAKNPLSPTVWQTRAREVATTAIRKLPPDSSYAEKLCAGSAAVRQITSAFEDDELRKRTLQGAYLWDIRPDEHEDAKEAMRRQLESLPVGTPARTMEKAREQVLAPLRETKRRKDRIERAVPRIRGYLTELRWAGEVDFESDWDLWNLAKRLEGRIRPALDEELQNDELTDHELSELVEELVDEALD